MSILIWIAFIVMILGLLALDLGVFHRSDRAISIKEAFAWTGFWVALALAFNVFIYVIYDRSSPILGSGITETLDGTQAALQFLTGYIIEKSLSVDNIFVIAMIFTYFKVPLALQHRVLFWGILGALVLRGVMIGAGAVLVARFWWMNYVFGALLLLTAVRLLIVRHDNLEPGNNPAVRLVRRLFPVTDGFEGHRFIVRRAGRLAVTPLFITLLVIESTDLLFAIDSIPAIFAVTQEPFLVFTSNVFAILGLRSLYFALAGAIAKFRYLKMSLVFLLAYVGVKMLLSHQHPIPIAISMAIIGGILFVGVTASVLASHRDTAALLSPIAHEVERLAAVGLRQARRIVILIVGSTVLLIGVAMMVLPGPAFLVVPAGLAILAVEFAWARRWLAKIRSTVESARNSLGILGAAPTNEPTAGAGRLPPG